MSIKSNSYYDESKLKINPSLPQITLPNNKIKMLLDWYNKDLRLQKEIPTVFPKGYMFINTNYINIDITSTDCKEFIKHTAKELKATYRYVENQLQMLLKSLNNIVIFFKIKDVDHECVLDIYSKDDMKRISTVSFSVDPNMEDVDRIIDPVQEYQLTEFQTWEGVLHKFNYYVVCLFASIFWYMATTTKTKKYKYTDKDKKEDTQYKKIVNTKSNKIINTPIYDMKNIKIVEVDRLIKRREGYTYSHSFMVHGHYRHYKDGKVIFIESYEKGKGKEFKPQKIKIDPKY